MNDYFRKVCHIKHYMKNCLKEVFGSYQNELLLNLEDQNLLESPQNSLESATAMGYLLEEFVISKLEKMTKKYKNFEDEIKIQRKSKKQKGHRSYDCFANFNNILFLINIKVQKKGSNNNAIAAISNLYNDYVLSDPEIIKSYIVVKINYYYANSKIDNKRKVMIDGFLTYALEEIDFSKGYKQDHRNWSVKFDFTSGRLIIPKSWARKNKLDESEISYELTKKFIENIYNPGYKK